MCVEAWALGATGRDKTATFGVGPGVRECEIVILRTYCG